MTTLSHLEITNLRCFSSWHAELKPRLNLIVGPNGAGKTSLLEAVHLLLRQRSFRSNSNNDVIRWGAAEGLVVGRFATGVDAKPQIVGLKRDRAGFTSRLNGEPVTQRADLIEKFPLVLITPASTVLVSGGPSERRQYLDQLLFHVERSFISVWRAYRSALSQRNALLRSGSIRGLDVWDEQLVKFGNLLNAMRNSVANQLAEPLAENLRKLDQQWDVALNYRSGWGKQWGDAEFAESLEESRFNDCKRATTTRGPHRAELTISSAAKPVSESLSRGQQRVLATALLITHMQLLTEKSALQPLVLIDDIGAELDHVNANKVIDLCASFGGQMLVTALESKPYMASDREAELFHVEH